MTEEDFQVCLHAELEQVEDVLGVKAKEYATDDRLHNFKVAARVQGSTLRQAVGGMMVKHTVSVYDLINSDAEVSLDVWNEKVTDHINYLILLKACVYEEKGLLPDANKNN